MAQIKTLDEPSAQTSFNTSPHNDIGSVGLERGKSDGGVGGDGKIGEFIAVKMGGEKSVSMSRRISIVYCETKHSKKITGNVSDICVLSFTAAHV